MAELVTFLNARLDETEAEQAQDVVARRLQGGWHNTDCSTYDYDPEPCDCGVPTRVLAGVTAKRAILREFQRCGPGTQGHSGLRYAVDALAHAYADHPDFDPAWLLEDPRGFD